MEFWVSLIQVALEQSHHAMESLQNNCVHVSKDLYIMEGDTDTLRDDGVKFRVVAVGSVGSLGGLSELELKKVCLESFNIRDPFILKTLKGSEDVLGTYNPHVTLKELERLYILKAMDHFEGNKTRAAFALGVTMRTLYNKLYEYGEYKPLNQRKKSVSEVD